MNRRRLLTLLGAGGLAGCLGDGMAGSGAEGTDPGSGTGSVSSHPAATDLRDQPRRGDLGGHLIVAFEDPSCRRCAAFERDVVPEIRRRLVEPGAAAFVFRNYPVVYPWGEPAARALEATFARDESAFWALADHYFETQSAFSTDNVLGRTESFLAAETAVDAGAVVADAGTDSAAVQADVTAAEAAGLGETTPVVALFRDGQFVTTANGSVSYDLIANTLGEA